MAEIQKNIGTTEAPLYIPEGSPADLLKNNPTAYNQQYGNVNTVNTAQPSPQTVNATPYTNQQPSPMTNTSDLKAGLQAAVQSGQPAPDSMGQGASAVQAFSTTAAATPTFYKPDPNSQQVVNAKGEKLSYDQYIAQGGKADFSNVQAGNAPVYKPTPIQGIEAQLAQDPGYQQLLNDYSEYNNAVNQTKSLADTYNQIASSSGLDSINTQLLNTKKIIEGTEEDIRNEVKAVSGFASDSQVLALASARNKTLIKNYNALVDQQTNIQNKVNTMVNLASQDRTYALQVAQQKLQIDEQLLNYRQKFIQNAQEAYKNTISAIGYDGLYALVDGDPKSISLIEKTLGLPSGGLNQAATTANQQRLAAQEKQQLELQQTKTSIEKTKAEIAQMPLEQRLKEAQIGQIKAQTSKIYADIEKDKAPTTSNPLQQAQQEEKVSTINSILKTSNLGGAVGAYAIQRSAIMTGARRNFVASVEQIRSNLNLEALINAKSQGATFGALSDQELKVLSNSATKLGSWAITNKKGDVIGYAVSHKDFKKELDKINNFAKLDYILKGGQPQDIGVQKMPDGTYWTQNSDGSMTQL